MSDAFTPAAGAPLREGFTPTLLIAALDAARREAAARAERPPEPGADPTAALLAEARRSGWEDGHAAGLAQAAAAAEAVAARAAEHALAALRDGTAAARDAAADAAAGLARIAIAMMAAALPGLAAGNGAALAAAFARRMAPLLEAMPEARLLVSPGFAAETRALLGLAGIAVEEDPALPPGDARAEWRGGGAVLDLSARRAEIRRVLDSAGLGPKE